MTFDPHIRSLLEQRMAFLKHHNNNLSHNAEREQEVIRKYLSNRSALLNFSITHLDLHAGRFVFHRSAFKYFLCHPVISEAILDNLSMDDCHTHPDDLCFSLETEILIYNYIMQLPFEKLKDSEVAFSRRIQEKDGGCSTYIHHVYVGECDQNGCPWILKIETRRLEKSVLPCFRLFFPVYEHHDEKHAYSLRLRNLKLSSREIDVMHLLVRRYTMSEIADELNISPDTVNSHYRKINKKLQVTSISEAREIAIISRLLV